MCPEKTDPPWLGFELPDRVLHAPAMMNGEERRYLAWLTAECLEGFGAIVDLGPWLGGSSVALAHGLRMAGRDAVVHSLDHFVWERNYMESVESADLEDGADFMPLFLEKTRDYERWLRPRRQDLSCFRWDGGDVEILFIDAAKSWQLTNSILAGFSDHLVPGRSRVVLQDFRYHGTYFLPLIFDGRPDVWREMESVGAATIVTGTTVTFMPIKPPLGPGGIARDYSDLAFPPDVAEHVFHRRIARVDAARRKQLLAGLYRKLLIDMETERAAEVRRRLLEEDGPVPDDLELATIEDVISTLLTRGWQALGTGRLDLAGELGERAARSPSRRREACHLLTMVSLRSKDLEAAAHWLAELEPWRDEPAVRLCKAEFLLAGGKRNDEAEGLVLAILHARPEREATLEWAFGLLERLWQDVDLTVPAIRLGEIVATLPSSPIARVAAAKMAMARGDPATARRWLERALGMQPGHRQARELRRLWFG